MIIDHLSTVVTIIHINLLWISLARKELAWNEDGGDSVLANMTTRTGFSIAFSTINLTQTIRILRAQLP